MTIHEQPEIFRPRERLLNFGADNLSTEDLIAILLSWGIKGADVTKVARDIVLRFGDRLTEATVEELCEIRGLGKVKAIQLKAAIEIGIRYSNNTSKITVNSSRDAYTLLHEYAGKKQEHFLLITMNGRNQLISKKVITIGTLDSSLFHPREIFAESIVDRAAKIIVAHNHPSGNLDPSSNDLIMTRKIREAGEIIGIKLVDSLIISEEGYRSIAN